MITAVTCTGDRPLAFDLCRYWMSRQTRQPDQWVVVDDGAIPMVSPPEGCTYVRRAHDEDGHNSLAQNILAAIPEIKGNIIMFIEDDDYYRPDYIETIYNKMWSSCVEPLFGQSLAVYYNVKYRWWMQHPNRTHASLCQTAMYDDALPTLKAICEASPKFIDLDLWRQLKGDLFDDPIKYCVGIKGLPGRGGIGMGHKIYSPEGQYDHNYTKFFKLLRADGLKYFEALGFHPAPILLPVELQAYEQDYDGNYIIPKGHTYGTIKQSSGNYKLVTQPNQIVKGQFKGQTCYIVGKGQSLDNLTSKHFDLGPVIAMNESVVKVNSLGLSNPQYGMQQDYVLGETCWNRHGAMILSGKDMDKLYTSHPQTIRLPMHTPQPSIYLATDVAINWGCTGIVFLCCDAHAKGNTELARGIGYTSKRFGEPQRYLDQTKDLLMKLNSLNREFVCP